MTSDTLSPVSPSAPPSVQAQPPRPAERRVVDANTRMQLETARTINELIGVSNGAVSALNTEMQMRLTQQSETAKMLQYKDINPFK